MLDLLFNPEKAERHPFEISLIGIFYSSLSILLGLWIFNGRQGTASLAIIFLTTLSCLYVIQGAIKMEEKKEKNYNSERWIIGSHRPIVFMILALFLGFVISFALWSLFLPPETSSTVFSLQKDSVDHIRAITGNAISTGEPFMQILKNNVNIVLISIVFAFFFGAGAVYIIAWNASVMGFVIGSAARESLGLLALPVAAVKYFIHGIPEMIAYIIASVAGGILYFALIRGDLTKEGRSKRIIIDAIALFLISILILVIAAIIEVYISPLL